MILHAGVAQRRGLHEMGDLARVVSLPVRTARIGGIVQAPPEAFAGLTLRIPRPRLCTDNGAMIASFAAHLIAAGAPPSPLDAASDPSMPVVKGQVA